MRRFLKASALAVVGLLVAIPALADVGPPVTIHLLGKPRAAEFGVPFEGQVEITPDVATELSDFHFEESPGWTTMSLAAPNATRMEKSQRLVVDFTVLPSNPNEWLTLSFMMDGRLVSKSFDLSEAHFKRVTTPGTLAPAKEEPDTRGEVDGKELLSPEPTHRDGAQWAEKGGSPDKSRSIRVYGRFVYQRSDGVTLGADGVTVRVYDEDSSWDELLAELVTDAYGNYDVTFTWDPCWACDGEPDIYVHFETTNARVTTESATWPTYDNYSWETGTHDDYTGSSLSFGTLQPSAESDHPAVHIQTDLTRTWRWLLNHEGYNMAHVSAQWPDGAAGAWYSGDSIHVGTDRQWREDTHTHEYGHHWVAHYATAVAPDYCNGTCDSPTCGHCIWCAETDHDALAEGWPNWLCDVITRSYAGDYGTASQFTRSQESLGQCSTGVYDSPLTTEGFLGALCRDIEDAGQDSHGVYGAWTDRLALGTDEIFDVMDIDQPTTPMGFLNAFKARFPSTKENLWETAKNCGYEIDVANPSAPTSLTSSHAVGSDSPDPTVQFNWTRAADDASGVSGYGITIAGTAGLPSAVKDINDVTTYTTTSLVPGTYYFSIRTIDRSGRWGSGYAWYGPFTIRAPEPANLTYTTVAGWDGPLVPRGTADATSGAAVVSATLPGNTASSYWNVRGLNNGESSTSIGFQSRLYVDDVYMYWASWGSIGAGGGFWGANIGPVTVRGGRHVYEVRYDALDAISETNETDNAWGHQWIWTPYMLTANTAVTRSAPPPSSAGWGSIIDGSTIWYNTDGVRFNSSGWWNAAVLRPLSTTYDYDLRMHAASTGATNGFAANIGWSANGAGSTDAVFSNRNVVGTLDYDVGVLNHGGDTGNYEMTHVTSQPFAFGDSLTVPFATNQELRLWEFYVAPADTGNVSITVDCDPMVGQFHAMWLGKAFTTGDLNDGTRSLTDEVTGRARLDVAIHQSGYNCLVVWRDPYGTGSAGTGATNVTIEIQGTPPDFVTYQAAGWHAPIVPRPLNDGTGASVALPDSLRGNLASTYLNLAVRNNSPTTAAGLPGQIHLDGVYTWWLAWGSFPGYANSLFNWSTAWTIRGGRHTLALWLDQDNAYEEMWENNNRYGEQYAWSPYILAPNTPVSRSLPPDLTGGWEDITNGDPLWFNCDGLRLPNTGGWWRAVAVMPGATSNVDVRLHPLGTGVKTPFGSNLAYSGWGPGLSDYVLVNFNVVPWTAYDVGVLRQSSVVQNYTAETTSSAILSGSPTGGTFGPFTLAANRMLGLHEVYLSAGVHVIRLHNTAGTVDWGLTLHPSSTGLQTKSTAVANGSAWFAGAGQDEYVLVDLPAAGWYCVAVWKRGAADLPLSGSYQLTFPASSGVPGGDVPPAATALVGIHPNPFNPETRVTFDLAGSQQVKLAVYDLKGNLVRTLVDESRPAGRHEVVWNGRDANDRQVASGVYMARLVAGGVSQMQKMIMVK
jgi:hypothetical protein